MSGFIECMFTLPVNKFRRVMIGRIVKRLSKFEVVMTRAEWVERFRGLKNTKSYQEELEDAKQWDNYLEVRDYVGKQPIDRSLQWHEDKFSPPGTIAVTLGGQEFFYKSSSFSQEDLPWAVSEEEADKLSVKAFDNLVRDAKIIYEVIHPDHGFLYWTSCSMTITAEALKEQLYWVNFYGPTMAKRIGKQKLLSAPAYQVEGLKDGGILLRLMESWGDLNILKRKIAVAKHLGFKRPIQKILEHGKGSTEERQKELKKMMEET